MRTYRSLLVGFAMALAGCGDNTNHVNAIAYAVSEYPSSGKVPWSCLPAGHVDGAGASAINWTVGAPLVAYVGASFERACGFYGASCPDPQLALGALDASTWAVAIGSAPGSSFGPNARYLEAVAAGAGGMTTTAQGRTFPPLTVHAVEPAAFRFFTVDSSTSPPTLTSITRLALAAGTTVSVVPQLVDRDGKALCGFPTMTATPASVTIAPDATFNKDGRANAPVQITAASAQGSVHFAVSNASGDLPVDVM